MPCFRQPWEMYYCMVCGLALVPTRGGTLSQYSCSIKLHCWLAAWDEGRTRFISKCILMWTRGGTLAKYSCSNALLCYAQGEVRTIVICYFILVLTNGGIFMQYCIVAYIVSCMGWRWSRVIHSCADVLVWYKLTDSICIIPMWQTKFWRT